MSLAPIISSYWYSQLLYTAASLGVADALHPSPLTLDALAHATQAHPDALKRIMRALTTLGLFTFDPDALTYALNPLSDTLRDDHPNSIRPLALLTGAPWHWSAWSHTLDAARTGQTAFSHAHNQDFFGYLDDHPDARTLFNRVMTGPEAWNTAVANAWDGPPAQSLVDIGGGHGALARAFLERWPDCHARILERPALAAETPSHPRIQAIGGDFFDAIPAGAELYLLRFILHDWDDADATRILRRCREAMTTPGARLLIVERLLDRQPQDAALLDVTMLVLTGGRERTESEYRILAHDVGLRLERVIPTTAGLFILEVSAY